MLTISLGKFIEVWRQKEAALENSKLTRLLLANSAHEVRTPLNAIINYLEIALEGSLDQETRENLARSHSASKSLIYVINDLLDLTKTEEGQNLVKDEIFELPACIKEATEPFYNDTRRKGLEYQVIEHPGLPRFVHGDGRRVRQALANVTANAVAHTDSGFVRVEVFVSDVRDGQAVVDFVVADSGMGMSTQQLDSLFRDLEQVSTEESETNMLTGVTKAKKPAEARTLGLGLAVVARIVRNMDGQLRLKSEAGQGSRFVVQLPFQVPDESPSTETADGNEATPTAQLPNVASTAPASLTAAPEGEIMLVDRGSTINVSTDPDKASVAPEQERTNPRHSMESSRSLGSQKSDADRLIDAIQTPLSLHDREPQYPLSRQSSIGSSNRPASKGSQASAPKMSTSPVSQKQGPPSPIKARNEPGTAAVRDSATPIKPIKVPDDYQDMPARPQVGEKSGVLFEVPQGRPRANTESVTSVTTGDGQVLQVLIAEDDPINMKILRKRLERSGHEVHHAVNGQDCATIYKERSPVFDVVLMDMQVSRNSINVRGGRGLIFPRCLSSMV